MRICIFTDSFLPYISGVSSAVFNQANELAARGHEVSIFHPKPHRRDCGQLIAGLNPSIKVHALPVSLPTPNIPKLRFAVPLFLYTYRRLNQASPDVIHVHTEFGCGLEGMLLGRWKKVPVVGTFHTFFAEPDYLKQFHLPNWEITRRAMWKYSVTFFNRCRQIISPSQSVKDHLVDRGLSREPVVMSNGIESVELLPDERIQAFRKERGSEGFTFVYVGRVSPEKSLGVALDAFAQTLASEPSAKFVLIGSGPSDKEVEGKIAEHGIQNSVIRTGRVERDVLMRDNYLRLGDVFVTASKTENQPISILEAMAFGLPLIGPRAKGIPELVEDGRNGLIFEPDDVDGMARRMLMLMRNRELTKAMGRASLEIAASHNIGRICDELESIYRRALVA